MSDKQRLLSAMPAVDEVLRSASGISWLKTYTRRYVIQAIREIIESTRQAILKGEITELVIEDMFCSIEARLQCLSELSLKTVINATGTVIHTNLGRSVLTEDILDNVKRVACGYSNLEYDIPGGKRGKRYSHVQKLIRDITGAEAGLIVNNNAAAVLVCLAALAQGKEVIVSRGELVEIGGSFRIPDVMSSSGALLREVGTTNKTHIQDYERAICDKTALLLKVHQSNYRMVGFTKAVELDELAALGRKHNVPVMFDLGSGCLVDLKPYGINIEPTVQSIVKTGCDIVTFSGDKLLGGPQGGIIVGKKKLIEKISGHPLMRAVRIDKLTLAAFESVLMKYLDEETAKNEIPTLRMLLQKPENIKQRAEKLIEAAKAVLPNTASVTLMEDSSQSGGGALPEIEFPTFVVALKPQNISVNKLEEQLRLNNPCIIARIKDDTLILDARTIQDSEIEAVAAGLKNATTDTNNR
ncbi:MAG: L-seryl-tRNA(Sec) selenium transferase [Nitrospirae bacterium]|nr:L-seryl-tRNA(Sec) selenium transferase [Nitrospirota bacterium]